VMLNIIRWCIVQAVMLYIELCCLNSSLPVNCRNTMAESGDHISDADRSADDVNAEQDPELQRLQAEEDELTQRVSAEVSEELSSHIARLEQELKHAFDERMSALHQQCSTQAAEVISTRQVCWCRVQDS